MKILLLLCADSAIEKRLREKGSHLAGTYELSCRTIPLRTDSNLIYDTSRLMAVTSEACAALDDYAALIMLSQESLDLPADVLMGALEFFLASHRDLMETPLFLPPFTTLRTKAVLMKGTFRGQSAEPYQFSGKDRERIFEDALSGPLYPGTVFIEVSSRCNLHCPLCPCHGSHGRPMPGSGNLMAPSFYRDIIEEIDSWKRPVTVIPQFRGESCIHPDFPAMLRLARRSNFSLSLNTNGTCLTGEIIDAIVENVDSLFLSLDAARPETYEKMRKGADFKAVMEGIERLLAVRRARSRTTPVIYTSFVRCADNEGELDAFLSRWHDDVEGVMVYQPRDTRGHCAELFNGSPSQDREPCIHIATSAAILADGNVVPCCNDNFAQMSMGSIRERSLVDIFNGAGYRDFRMAHARGDYDSIPLCRHCDIWRWHHLCTITEEKWTIHENPPSRLYLARGREPVS